AGAADASASSVSADPDGGVTADGTASSEITVTLRDAYGNPVPGQTVTLGQGVGSSDISVASGLSSASGEVTFTVTNTTAETVTYSATVGGRPAATVFAYATLLRSAGAADASASSVSADPDGGVT